MCLCVFVRQGKYKQFVWSYIVRCIHVCHIGFNIITVSHFEEMKNRRTFKELLLLVLN